MTIKEVSIRFGISADTLRYYEKVGLLGPVMRNASGVRDYQEEDLERIEFIKCMRAANISIENLYKYIKYYDFGDEKLEERRAILQEQKELLEHKLVEMQQALTRLNKKISIHDSKIMDRNKSLS